MDPRDIVERIAVNEAHMLGREMLSDARDGVRDGLRRARQGFWAGLVRMFYGRQIKHVVRMGIIGQPGSGKTRLLANLVLDRDKIDVGATINWQAEAHRVLREHSPTYEPTVLLEGTFYLHRLRGVPVPFQFVDTMGGLTIDRPNSPTFSDEQRSAFRDALRMLDVLVLVVDPDLVFADDTDVLQANLAQHVSVVLANRAITSVALVYTKADAYGIQYGSCGRLLDISHQKRLASLATRLQGRNVSSTSGPLAPSLRLERRFPRPSERAVVEDLVNRTESLWRSILLHGPHVPWQFNAYVVAGEPALPEDVRKVQHGVGFDLVVRDFLARVKQPWWPFWDAPRGA